MFTSPTAEKHILELEYHHSREAIVQYLIYQLELIHDTLMISGVVNDLIL